MGKTNSLASRIECTTRAVLRRKAGSCGAQCVALRRNTMAKTSSTEQKDRWKAFRSLDTLSQRVFLALYLSPELATPARLARVNTVLSGASFLRRKKADSPGFTAVESAVRKAYRASQ
jgi:hypothetical protein